MMPQLSHEGQLFLNESECRTAEQIDTLRGLCTVYGDFEVEA